MSRIQLFRIGVVASAGIVALLWLVVEVASAVEPSDPFGRLYSSESQRVLPWWQIVFRLLIVLGILAFVFGSFWVGIGAVVIGQTCVLSRSLSQRKIRNVFEGFENACRIRRLVKWPR